ncbi:MAG: outer membrane protein transport protein [candidate division KSB1 bacterium]|nr:outer membrane protein transport protein [candidate division KSB1 bacterium]
MKKLISITIIALIQLAVVNSYGQDEAFFLGYASGVGGRALSMGSAYVAIADDYSATMWNPAGLTQLRRMELFTSLSHLQYSNKAAYQANLTTDKTTKTKLNSIGFAFPIPTYRGSLVFALGYNRVREFDSGLSFSWFNDSTSVQQNYTEIEEGGMNNWVFAGAVEVTENVSLGATLNLWRGQDDYHLNYLEDDVLNKYYYKNYSADQQLTTSYQATNFKLGALYKFARFLHFGATIATPVTLNAKENWSEALKQVEDPDSPSQDFENTASGSWNYKLKSPFVFAVGASFSLLPNIVLSGDVEYTDWSQTRYASEPPTGEKFRKNLNFKQDFEATAVYRVGGEFTVPLINTQLRAGMVRQPSPMKLASSKADRNYLTVGGGVLLDKQVKVEFAWVHGWWERDSSSLVKNLNEKITIDKFFATMSIRF